MSLDEVGQVCHLIVPGNAKSTKTTRKLYDVLPKDAKKKYYPEACIYT